MRRFLELVIIVLLCALWSWWFLPAVPGECHPPAPTPTVEAGQ